MPTSNRATTPICCSPEIRARSAAASRAPWEAPSGGRHRSAPYRAHTPRSNVATYTGMFDHIRKLFAATPAAKKRNYKPGGRFSFNVAGGRCPTCEGEGFVMIELLFLPSVYSPCPDCNGTRYTQSTLEITWRDRNIADVLAMSIDEAHAFFTSENDVLRSLTVLREVGLGYLRLGQPATELSGGEAQRVKLASELQRAQRGDTLYILDEPLLGSTRPTATDCSLTRRGGSSTPTTPSSWSNSTCASSPRPTTSSTSDRERAPTADVSSPPVPPEQVAATADSATAPYLRAALENTAPAPHNTDLTAHHRLD